MKREEQVRDHPGDIQRLMEERSIQRGISAVRASKAGKVHAESFTRPIAKAA